MKELSIKEKAKRYDEAIERAKKHYEECKMRGNDWFIEDIEDMFPELKKSEDERIRKKICKLLWDNAPYEEAQEYITWLEKQGEQKLPIEKLPSEVKTPEESLGIDSDTYNKIVDECIYGEQKHTDNVEPKFKVGDWVVYTGYLLKDSGKEIYVMQVASVEDDRYNFTDTSTLCFDSEKDMRSWTIQDAKAGDVLVASDKSLFIYDGSINENGSVGFHIAFAKDTDIILNSDDGCGWEEKDSCHPATKEQRDQLEKAMADAGYTFDFEKKELKKIEQKHAWTEEDELHIRELEGLVKRVWAIAEHKNDKETIHKMSDLSFFLKTLKPQLKQEWKPSDEQLNNILDVLSFDNCTPKRRELLESLYNDLKKL